jgi:hypothetical protein
MMAAEKWFEYQTSYQKYGLDMKPPKVEPKKQKKRNHRVAPSVQKIRPDSCS